VWICSQTLAAVADVANVDREREVAQPAAGEVLQAHRLLGVGGSQLISLRALPSD
jgi:hypothetical protein